MKEGSEEYHRREEYDRREEKNRIEEKRRERCPEESSEREAEGVWD